MYDFTAEPIAGHERNHWQVVRHGQFADEPWCETVGAEKAWITAAALNRYQQATTILEDDGLAEP